MKEGGDGLDRTRWRSPSRAVVEAVARAESVAPTELCPPEYEPLHDVVDPQALDALFAPKSNGIPRDAGRVSFSYCGYDVTVEGDESVVVSADDE